MIISKQHHCTSLLLLSHIFLLLLHSFNGVLGTQPTSRAPTLIHHDPIHHQKDYHDRFLRRRRQAPAPSPPTCPLDRTLISPCTCSNNKTSKNGLPEISCINFDGSSGQIPLDRIFRNLSNYIAANGQEEEFERLLLVNSQTNTINETLFHGLEFRYLSIYETNLTDVGPASFYDMEDVMQYLLIKGDRLQNIFPALPRLKLLTTLILNLGTSSFERIPRNALINMPALQRVTMNGVVNVIERNAFVNLTALQLLKITNQLERIESDAFIIEYAEEGAQAFSPAPNGSMTITEANNDPWSADFDPNEGPASRANRSRSMNSGSGENNSNSNNNNNDSSSRSRNYGDNIWGGRDDSTSSTTEGRSAYAYSGDVRENEDNNNNDRFGENTSQRNNGDNSRGGPSVQRDNADPSMRDRSNNNNGNNFGGSEESSGTNRNSNNNNANSPNSMQENNNGRFSSQENNGGGGGVGGGGGLGPSPGGRNNLPGGPSGGIPGGGQGGSRIPGGPSDDAPSVGQDSNDFSSTESPGNSTSNSTESPISHEVTIDLSNNKLDENSFGVGFIRLVPSLSINLDLTYNWIRYLPEDIFRPFFEVNSANRLQLMNNKFECGRCDSYWIIRNASLTRDRLNVNCYMNSQNTVWNYDWSHCNNDTDNLGNVTSTPGGNGSANIQLHQQLLLTAVVVVIQLLAYAVSLF